jgi:hypothetical protein
MIAKSNTHLFDIAQQFNLSTKSLNKNIVFENTELKQYNPSVGVNINIFTLGLGWKLALSGITI